MDRPTTRRNGVLSQPPSARRAPRPPLTVYHQIHSLLEETPGDGAHKFVSPSPPALPIYPHPMDWPPHPFPSGTVSQAGLVDGYATVIARDVVEEMFDSWKFNADVTPELGRTL